MKYQEELAVFIESSKVLAKAHAYCNSPEGKAQLLRIQFYLNAQFKGVCNGN